MDMTELLKMKLAQQQAPMNAAGEFAQTLGGILGQRGQRSFQQDAIRYFTQNEVTPDSIQQFTSQYQGVDPVEVFKIAGTVAAQKKAQKVKNMGLTIARIVAENNGTIPQEKFGELLKGVDGELMPDAIAAMQALKKTDPKFDWVKLGRGEIAAQLKDGKLTGLNLKGENPDEEKVYITTPDGYEVQVGKSTADELAKQPGYHLGKKGPSTGSAAPHTKTEYSADGKSEREVIWDEQKKKFVEMEGGIGQWHPVRSQVISVNAFKPQQTENIDDDGSLLTFVPGKGYLRPDGSPAHNAGKRIPAETLISNATFDSLEETAKNIMANKDWKKFVGPLDSILARVQSATIGYEDFAKFRAGVEQMIETSYALSGKQISEKEIKMLENLRGSINQPDTSFKGAMDAYQEWLKQKKVTRKEAFGSQGYVTGDKTAPKKPLSAY